MHFSNAKEYFDELSDIIDNGLDDLRAHVENIPTKVYAGETGPEKDETEDGEVLDEVNDDVEASFAECRTELGSLIERLTRLRTAMNSEL